ncbi:MAG: AtpZ/AtpI family protein [Betaproteobacteria bacterium]|nr:AtpZ/AtpI family protein [Gammaproteobacteria bacterium]MDH3435966.1 AtpZ/AtpI family protein [Betaproteobacteria bacterium]
MKPDAAGGEAERRELETRVGRQVERIKRADRERPTLLGQSVFLGTIGVLFVIPIVAGAFLGRWLDEKMPGYTVGWTVSLILLGVVIGAYNVFLFVRE